jgi:short-subunit dehydrogenase
MATHASHRTMGTVKKTALVTGATTGIGRELAKQLARSGHDLVIVARHQEMLDDAAARLRGKHGVQVTPIACDLFRPGAAEQLYRDVNELGLRIDLLVNNAGQGEWGKFHETDLARQLDIIQLDVTSLVTLTHLYLRDMVARNDGRILNVASVAGTMPMPLMAVYAASKAFVLSFSEALHEELRQTGVTVTCLAPGSVETDWWDKANARHTRAGQAHKAEPGEVARAGLQGLSHREARVIPGIMAKAEAAAARVLPDTVVARRAETMMERVDGPTRKS